jgi:hypothetical protein
MGKTVRFSEKQVLPLKTVKNGFAPRKRQKSAGGKRGRGDRRFLSP